MMHADLALRQDALNECSWKRPSSCKSPKIWCPLDL